MSEAKNIQDIEPPAAARKFAKELHDIYVSMIKEGFTPQDALMCIAMTVNFHIT